MARDEREGSSSAEEGCGVGRRRDAICWERKERKHKEEHNPTMMITYTKAWPCFRAITWPFGNQSSPFRTPASVRKVITLENQSVNKEHRMIGWESLLRDLSETGRGDAPMELQNRGDWKKASLGHIGTKLGEPVRGDEGTFLEREWT